MLIGCITGPDLETAKSQIKAANELCEGIELRADFLQCPIEELKPFAKGLVLITDSKGIRSKDLKISTYHNFDHTPEDLEAILEQMPPADIYKIATFAHTTTEALRMLCFVKEHSNVAGMCMGPLGQITRILAPVVGSPLTFAAIGREAAPGQMQADELQKTYNFHGLNKETKLYGLIGNPVAHSRSHIVHNAFFQKKGINAVYVKMPLNEDELKPFFPLAKKVGFKGLSVTMPFKEKVMAYVDELDIDAAQIGAVNTLVFAEGIKGYNTDGIGALNALNQPVAGTHIVILGAGGAAKAIAFEAEKRGAHVSIHSRRFQNLNAIPEYDILINATPNPCPIALDQLKLHRVVMDITTRHANSSFLNHAKSLGCRIVEGEAMFHLQAQEQYFKWGHIPSA